MGRARPAKKLMVGLPLSSGIIKYGQIPFCVKKTRCFFLSKCPHSQTFNCILWKERLKNCLKSGLSWSHAKGDFPISLFLQKWSKINQWWHRIAIIKFAKDLRKKSQPNETSGTSGHSRQLINLTPNKNSFKYLFNSLHSPSVITTRDDNPVHLCT